LKLFSKHFHAGMQNGKSVGQSDHDHVRDASPLAIRVTRTSDRKEGGRKAFENDVLKKSAELLRFFFMTLLAKIPANSRVSEFKLSRQEQVKNVQ